MKLNLSIRDYFAKSGINLSGAPPKSMTAAKNSSEKSLFEEILTGLNNPEQSDNYSGLQGLTISDYINNPIRNRSIMRLLQEYEKASIEALSENKITDMIIDNNSLNSLGKAETNDETAFIRGLSGFRSTVGSDNIREIIDNESIIRQKIDGCIEKAAEKYNLPTSLIKGIIRAESGFQADAVSRAGAKGLMQLMPGTAKDLGVLDPFDVEQNIDGGSRYFKEMMDRFDGNVHLALAAYNSGPGSVLRYQGIPPYKETRQYIRRVLDFSQEYA